MKDHLRDSCDSSAICILNVGHFIMPSRLGVSTLVNDVSSDKKSRTMAEIRRSGQLMAWSLVGHLRYLWPTYGSHIRPFGPNPPMFRGTHFRCLRPTSVFTRMTPQPVPCFFLILMSVLPWRKSGCFRTLYFLAVYEIYML